MAIILSILALSFCLGSFYYIMSLRQKVRQLEEKTDRVAMIENEISQTLTDYMIEMKNENEKFLLLLEKNNNKKDSSEELKRVEDEAASPNNNKFDLVSLKSVKEAYTHPFKEDEHFEEEKSIEFATVLQKELNKNYSQEEMINEALKMKDSGKTIEEIARFFKKGKTEMELFMKFQK